MHDTGAVISVPTRQQDVVFFCMVLNIISTMSDAKLNPVTATSSQPEQHHSMATVATTTSITGQRELTIGEERTSEIRKSQTSVHLGHYVLAVVGLLRSPRVHVLAVVF